MDQMGIKLCIKLPYEYFPVESKTRNFSWNSWLPIRIERDTS